MSDFNASQKATDLINHWLANTSHLPVTLQMARLGLRITEALEAAYKDGQLSSRPADGAHLVNGRDGGGRRDFLEGRAITCGTVLEYWTGNQWIGVRYEVPDFNDQAMPVMLYLLDRMGKPIPLDRQRGLLRWPEPGKYSDG